MVMRSTVFSASAVLLALMACSAAYSPRPAQGTLPKDGAGIFQAECALCHGPDGKLGLVGAKDLTVSSLGRDEMISVATFGKGAMTGFKERLSPAQIELVVDHVRSLRGNP